MREVLRDFDPPIELHVAADGEEALVYLRRAGKDQDAPIPQLIFLDFNLPKSNSREVLEFIKKDAQLRLIPVAVLTTSDADRDIREAYELHANCYLRKPADLDGFFKTIREAVHFWLKVAHVPDEIESGAAQV